jgi:hypothetical protein
MHGNVAEFCQDLWHDRSPWYEGAPADGSVWEGGSLFGEHVVRGGHWKYSAASCRSAGRSSETYLSHYLGFRVAATWHPTAVASHAETAKPSTPDAPPRPAGTETPSTAPDDLELKHDWKIEEAKDGTGVNYTSRHAAPPPFSYNQEPEALLAVESEKVSGRARSLSEVVNSEIKQIRTGLLIGDYLEDDGHKPQNGIATWVEDIDGQQVAFIKYRVIGVKREGRTMPRSVIHAILIKNGKINFVHLTVLFAAHQDEMRADQMRLVRSIIRK